MHDGPGIRTTVFFKGCPLSCKWCANPESIEPTPEIMTYDMKCIKCGACIKTCPVKAITIIDNVRIIDRNKCKLCMECATVCPTGAVEKTGKNMSPEEAVKEIEKDKLFFKNSDGGVTFSGGEPLVQWQFLLTVAKKCKERNIATALDTTGCARWDVLEKVLEYIDLVLYDVKHLDPIKHIEGTGVNNELILDNFVKTAAKKRTWVRVPVIPNYNDSLTHIRRLGEFVKGSGVEKISLLPYHTWGEHKYERLGKTYPLKGVESLIPESLQEQKETLESLGLTATIGW